MSYEEYKSTVDALISQRQEWEGRWDIMRRFLIPRRETDDSGNPDWNGAGYNSTGNEALVRLAGGHMSHIVTVKSQWFKFCLKSSKDPNAEKWFSEATEIAEKELAASNFYTEFHECCLERSSLGTGALWAGPSKNQKIYFSNIECGKFSCAENEEGIVDTFVRELRFSAVQAAAMFGKENLGEKVLKALGESKKKYSKDFVFYHIVRPRTNFDKKLGERLNLAFESVYLSEDDKRIVEEDGMHEFPYCVTRFLKWGNGPFGFPPGWYVRKEMMRANIIEETLDDLAMRAANPSTLELADQVGEIDLRAAGRTIVSPEAAQLNLPRTWANEGRYDIGLDRLDKLNDKIKSAFYWNSFSVVSDLEREVTATQVIALENEKMLMFSPSYSLFASDFQPMMTRIFNLLYRMGKFNNISVPIPGDLFEQIPGEEMPRLKVPDVEYMGKIAIALDRLQASGLLQSMQVAAQLASVFPEIAEAFKARECGFIISRTNGSSEDGLRSDDDIAALDEQKEQAAQMEQKLAMAKIGAQAAKDGAQAMKTSQEAGL